MKRVSAPGYDLFKLIVALILLVILIIMLLRGCATNTPLAGITEITTSITAETFTPSPVPPTDEPTAIPTIIPPTPMPTVVPTESPTPVPVTTTEEPIIACNTSVPSRLSVGQNAKVIRNLNMRNAPDIKAQLIQTNLAGTQIEIIGGPVCTPQGEYAYLWWQIGLQNGMEGWSAETPLIETSYFIEPIP